MKTPKKYTSRHICVFALEDKIQQIVALRNRVDHLEQQIELLRYEFTPATFSNLRYLNLDEIEDSFRVLLELVTKADQHQARIWERLIWKFIKNNRFNQVKDSFAEKKDLIKKIELDVSFETKALDEEILKDYKTFMDIFARRLDGVRAIKEYYDSLSKSSASVSWRNWSGFSQNTRRGAKDPRKLVAFMVGFVAEKTFLVAS